MRQKIISNIISSGVEKLFILSVQLISTVVLIRLLPRDDYGVIGVVIGYFAFINILNVSLESIVLKDHKIYDDKLKEVMSDFFMFNVIKSAIFLVIAVISSFFLSYFYDNNGFMFAIYAITFITMADSLTAPFIIYFTAKFNQKLVTKISIVRSLTGLIMLFGLLEYPQLWYVALKDLVVSGFFVFIWWYLAKKKLGFQVGFKVPNVTFLKETFYSYSLWTHLNGVVTNFIYRSDTVFLSLFVGLAIVGNYTVALNSANVANILPMILGYQNSVAISHAKDRNQLFKISNGFLKLSIAIGLVTLIIFYFLGDWYLWLVTGVEDNQDIFFYMISIVSGLVIAKSFASPLNAYINICGVVKELFKKVMFPLLVMAIILYFLSAYLYGAEGVALANIVIAFIWFLLIVSNVRKNGYSFTELFSLSIEYELMKRVLRRVK